MTKRFEVSNCILGSLFPFSSIVVLATNEADALRQYVESLKEELDSIDCEKIASENKDCIYKPIGERNADTPRE